MRPVTDGAAMPVELRADLDALFRTTPYYHEVGVVLDAWEPGRARLSMTALEAHANLVGTVHGGTIFGLADAAFEVACNSYGRLCVALDHVCHFASAGVVGEQLVADAVEVSRSRRVASYRVEVRGGDGSLRAWTMAVSHRTNRWHFGEDRWPEGWRTAH